MKTASTTSYGYVIVDKRGRYMTVSGGFATKLVRACFFQSKKGARAWLCADCADEHVRKVRHTFTTKLV